MKKKNNHTIAKLLCDERKSSYSIPAVSILLSMIVASILLLILGKNPIDAYGALLKGCGILPKARYGGGKGMLADFFTFLNYLAPMIIASLAFVVASRAGLFNIGIAGQMLLAAYVCYVLIGYSEMNAWIAKPLVVVVSLIVQADKMELGSVLDTDRPLAELDLLSRFGAEDRAIAAELHHAAVCRENIIVNLQIEAVRTILPCDDARMRTRDFHDARRARGRKDVPHRRPAGIVVPVIS